MKTYKESNQTMDKNHSDSLFYLDADGLFAYVNDCCCMETGYNRNELIANSLNNIGDISGYQNYISLFKLCMNGHIGVLKILIQRKDGTAYPAEINITQENHGSRMLLRCNMHCTVMLRGNDAYYDA